MLFVVFELGADRYAIEASRVAEVLPLVQVTRIPRAPDGVAGVFNYRGSPVPVIDLSQLILGHPAVPRLSTRVVLVHDPDEGGASRLLGLIAERATNTMRREAADFVASGVTSDDARYLGPVATDTRGVIQWIDPSRILPPQVREALFREAAGL